MKCEKQKQANQRLGNNNQQTVNPQRPHGNRNKYAISPDLPIC